MSKLDDLQADLLSLVKWRYDRVTRMQAEIDNTNRIFDLHATTIRRQIKDLNRTHPHPQSQNVGPVVAIVNTAGLSDTEREHYLTLLNKLRAEQNA